MRDFSLTHYSSVLAVACMVGACSSPGPGGNVDRGGAPSAPTTSGEDGSQVAAGGGTALPAGSGDAAGGSGTTTSAGSSSVQAPAVDPAAGPTVIDECADATAVTVGRTPIRRISRNEFNNSVRDLFQDSSSPARDGTFPADEGEGSFVSNSSKLTTLVNNEQFLGAAEATGKYAASNLSAVSGCGSATDSACIQGFLSSAASRAFRGAWDATAEADLQAFYQSAVTAVGAEMAFEAGIEAILLDSRFLYVIEFGVPAGAVSRLTGREVAGRLAAFLWGSVPTTELLQAADAGQFDTPDGVRQAAESMLDDPKAQTMTEDFASQWLKLKDLQSAVVDPALTDALAQDMLAETLGTVENAMLSGSFTELLTAPASPSAELSNFYGAGERLGVLTNGSVMASNPGLVKRGRLVREQVMCDAISEPPMGVEAAPEQQPDATFNDLLAQHAADPTCWGCHQFMDPVGIGFSFYDNLGRYSETENGLPLSTAGEFYKGPVSTLTGPFTNTTEMLAMLSGDAFIHKCFATQVMRYALSRSEQSADACSLSRAYAAFSDSALNIRELLLAITESDAFLHRNTVVAAGACQ